jgi:hypothetical protein
MGEAIREKVHTEGEILRENPTVHGIQRVKGEPFQECGRQGGSALRPIADALGAVVSFSGSACAVLPRTAPCANLAPQVRVFGMSRESPGKLKLSKLVATFLQSAARSYR